MFEISQTTIQIVAMAKILLFAAFVVFVWLIIKKPKAWLFVAAASIFSALFYIIMSYSMQNMFWGNVGDENFICAFLTQVMQANPLKDFYYNNLPVFYPPLYFWLVGLLGKIFAGNAIQAAKIGVTLSLLFWFAGSYLWQFFYYKIIEGRKIIEEKIKWLWFLGPLFFFFLVDFNDLVFKPYETLSALFVCLFVILISQAFKKEKWDLKYYLFFGLSGGILFLTYYFWWFFIIPVLFVLVLCSEFVKKNIIRIFLTGAIIFAVSAIFVIPLLLSYFQGIENWQAAYFIENDLNTFLPFAKFDWKFLLVVLGVVSLIIYRKKSFVSSNLIILLAVLAYYFINLAMLLAGLPAFLMSKAFTFLGMAPIALAGAYLSINLYFQYKDKLVQANNKSIFILFLIFSLPFWPMTVFIDKDEVRQQIQKNQEPPAAFYLSKEIINKVPDYKNRTWLSCGVPQLNAYIPIHYYLAHNPHFSHHASQYSQRLELVEQLSQAEPQKAVEVIENSWIDAILLYKIEEDFYPFFLRKDNYPNGGIDSQINIPKENIDSLNWRKVHEDKEWIILIK